MIFPLAAALVLTLATLLLMVPLALVPALLGRRQWPYWRAGLWLHAGLFLLHLFVTFPGLLGYWGSRQLGTRPHERTYAGPRLGTDGQLLEQDWDSLEREAKAGRAEVAETIVTAAARRQQAIPSSDGVTLRAFRLEATREPPEATAVLVHGLFRSALELEPVAKLLRELGCECWLVELRNHGGSSRAPFTAGLRESDDVVAAVQHVRNIPGRAQVPMVVFGVSLGTVAVSLALPRLDGLKGVVLDAPIDDLSAAARRLMRFRRPDDSRSWLAIHEPWQSLVLQSLELWSGFSVDAVVPAVVLANLPVDLPVLLVGAGRDDRATPETVQRLFDSLPMPAERRRLWSVPDSRHGRVFLDDPEGYREQLRWLLSVGRQPR